MARAHGFGFNKIPVITTLLLGIGAYHWPWLSMTWLPFYAVIASCMFSLRPKAELKARLPLVSISIMACAYLGFALIPIAYIFNLSDVNGDQVGRYLAALCILLVWGGDTVAYLVGSIFGKHPIAPVISPKKTYEGFFGNLLGNFAIGTLAKFTVLPQLEWFHVAQLTLIFGLLGFLGDLVESSWKRGSGIKDSSNLFPGHGGILDRIDSIFLTAPIYYALVTQWFPVYIS